MFATTDPRTGSPTAEEAPEGLRPDSDEAPGRPRGPAAGEDDRPTSFLDALRRMLASVHS